MSAGAGWKGICALWIGCLVIEVLDALLRKGMRLSRVVSNVREATAVSLEDIMDSCVDSYVIFRHDEWLILTRYFLLTT